MKIVVALGGNAISPPGSSGAVEEMRTTLAATAESLAALVADGVSLVVTHGNGPQVGRILLQQVAAAPGVPPMPMDVCGAESQGQLGYLLAQAMDNALRARDLSTPVLCLVTQVLVDGRDPAFRRPSKPVGPTYDQLSARRIANETGHVYAEMPAGGWRRVVASPRPQRIVEQAPLRQVVAAGHVVITAGGGGVPVVEVDGQLHGVEAVIDKDRTAAVLAEVLASDLLVVLTDVEHVYDRWGTPDQRRLDQLTIAQATRLLLTGGLAEGSIGPKVEACRNFVSGGGARAVITSLANVGAAVRGDGGTQFIP